MFDKHANTDKKVDADELKGFLKDISTVGELLQYDKRD